ncbi:MAG: MerR family transcriptional regulator [Proteobacteria bacterium]|nr:MerR family transcriptional regulator [Pseudomonadota bacterium]MBI3496036.1 MerR family transcriptional regulator [Pseudomonadota bacterium]
MTLEAGRSNPIRRAGKSATAFRTISEVADELDVPSHVLRFWETKFNQIRPLKRGGGRRYYRPEDVDLLRRIRELLYRDGYTIKGVQRLLRERNGRLGFAGDGEDPGPHPLPTAAPQSAAQQPEARPRATLATVLEELAQMKRLLAEARKRR